MCNINQEIQERIKKNKILNKINLLTMGILLFGFPISYFFKEPTNEFKFIVIGVSIFLGLVTYILMVEIEVLETRLDLRELIKKKEVDINAEMPRVWR